MPRFLGLNSFPFNYLQPTEPVPTPGMSLFEPSIVRGIENECTAVCVAEEKTNQ